MTTANPRPLDLETLVLDKGEHSSPEEGMCIREADQRAIRRREAADHGLRSRPGRATDRGYVVKMTRRSVAMPDEFWPQMREMAKRRDVSVSQLIRSALVVGLARMDQK